MRHIFLALTPHEKLCTGTCTKNWKDDILGNLSNAQANILDRIFQNIQIKNIGVEFSYVPLGRVRRLRDLILLRQVQAPILRARISENVSSMMEDFRSRDLCKDL